MNKRSEIGPTFEIEAGLCCDRGLLIAGIDEAGRGSLAGPLGVGMVIFNCKYYKKPVPEEFFQINDSKLLNSTQREKAYHIVKKYASVALYQSVSHSLIDKLNINKATEYAIKELLRTSPFKPDILLLDGNFNFNLDIAYKSVKKGDQKSLSIAAASVIAKVLRDKKMDEYALKYPDYLFEKHKGYGTVLHREKIQELGGTDIHRKSYEPLKSLISANA